MSDFLLSRRTLTKAVAALMSAVALPDWALAEEEEQPRRKFWFLDQRMSGLREFFHVYGYVGREIVMGQSEIPDFHGHVTFNGHGWQDFGWEVEQVLSSGKDLYRARVVTASERVDLGLNSFGLPSLVPDFGSAGPWMSPAEAESKHGIVIRRQAEDDLPAKDAARYFDVRS